LGNIFLLSIIFFGTTQFLTYFLVKTVLYISGSAILLYLGYIALKLKSEEIELSYNKAPRSGESIFAGFLIAITSPIVIAFWISLSGSYLTEFPSSSSAFLAIFFIVLGFVMFFFGLAGVVNLTRKRIPVHYVIILSKVFGIVLYGYGFFFIYKLISIL